MIRYKVGRFMFPPPVYQPEIFLSGSGRSWRNTAPFSVHRRPLRFLTALNSGLDQFSQVGKFLTVYSRNDAEAVRLAHELHTATRGLSGPKIHSIFATRSTVSCFIVTVRLLPSRAEWRGSYDYRSSGPCPASMRAVVSMQFRNGRITHLISTAPNGQDFAFLIQLASTCFLSKRSRNAAREAFIRRSISDIAEPARVVIIKEGRRHRGNRLAGPGRFCTYPTRSSRVAFAAPTRFACSRAISRVH